MLRLLVSAGGTGGGVYPALAIVAALGARAEVLWVGGEGGMEASLVSRAGVRFAAIPAAGVHGVGIRQLPGNVARLVRGISAARSVVRRYRPDVMVFTGGYVGVPIAIVAGRVPKVVYVPDIEPGLALRFVARSAQTICVTTNTARRHFGAGRRVVVSGYPTRPGLRPIPKPEARAALGLNPDGATLLVFGGSRGARSINEAVWDRLPELLSRAQLIHITGDLDWPKVAAWTSRLDPAAAGRYRAFPYLHDEMGAALSAADLAVARAGASTLGELPLFGLPAVLVPYPHAWRYQMVNARYLAEGGAAVLITDASLKPDLLRTVVGLLNDPSRLETMAAAARRLAKPGAAEAIAVEIERVVLRSRGADA